MTPTDTQLKQALAKMLPETFYQWTDNNQIYCSVDASIVKDTELLHLCWLVEKTLTDLEMYGDPTNTGYWDELLDNFKSTPAIHATWQQRTIALAKVKGIEIV